MFSTTQLIEKKRDGRSLTEAEIEYFVRGVTKGDIPDYQATAFLMAVYLKGMSWSETVWLTRSMLESGEKYVLSGVSGVKVDKHSTGGVGDKVSLILAPLAAACGLKVPMMSGRGLGFSGGTLDKLESIPGFRIDLDQKDFIQVLNRCGCSMIGQSSQIAPADKKLYSLRDVTGTVECIPLITASILSKKMAEGTQALVLDVKVGKGAFMKTHLQARALAKVLVKTAKRLNLPCRAVLTDMNQPLGYAVGNRLEVEESISVLKNETQENCSSDDLRTLTVYLCGQMLELAGVVKNLAQGEKLAYQKLKDGSAWDIFQKLVRAQGGSLAKFYRKPSAPVVFSWKAKNKGYLTHIQTDAMGRILIELGGGRKVASDVIDPSVGLIFHKKLGDFVQKGESLVTVFAKKETESFFLNLENLFQDSIHISSLRRTVSKLILECVL